MFRHAVVVGVVVLGACGFQIHAGSGGGGDDGGVVADGAVADEMVIDDPPPFDGNHADWWDPQWMHRRRITLDTSTLTGPVTDFPVLVRLPVLVGAQVNGGDLRFVSIDGTATYSYEIEGFNAAGTSPVWIKMTLASTADTELYVYWGNATTPAQSNGAAVFAGNHVSVHHLGSLLDATGNGHTAANGGGTAAPTTNIAGRIGAARTFDGTDDYLVLADSNTPYDFTTQMYASAWIHVTGFEDPYQAIVTKGDSSWRFARADSNNGVSFGWTKNGTNDNLLGDTPVANTEWHHVAMVLTPTAKYIYVDGQLDASSSDNDDLDNNGYSVRIGMNEESTTGGQRYWHGDIDEVRISAVSRDAAWIFAERKTADPAFVMVGGDEIY